MRTLYSILVFLPLLLLAVSCGGDSRDELTKLKDELAQKEKQYEELSFEIRDLEKEIAELDTTAKKNNGRMVTVIKPESKIFRHFIEVQGTATSDENVNVAGEVGGEVKKIFVEEGDEVQAGDVLLQIDNEAIQKQINELETALDLAQTVYDKQKRLYEKNIGSELEYLQAKNNKESLEDKLETAKTQLRKTAIKAPINGSVDYVMTKTGEFASPGAPLVRVVNLDKIKVEADASENYVTAVEKGDSVTVRFPILGIEKGAIVSAVGQVISPINRTFNVEVQLTNPDKRIKANLLALIKINDYENTGAIVLPTKYILQSHDNTFVYVAEQQDGKLVAVKRGITTGRSFNGETEVLSGLKAGEKVLAEGARTVADGEEISIKNTK